MFQVAIFKFIFKFLFIRNNFFSFKFMISIFWQIVFVVYNFFLNLHNFFHFFPIKITKLKNFETRSENLPWTVSSETQGFFDLFSKTLNQWVFSFGFALIIYKFINLFLILNFININFNHFNNFFKPGTRASFHFDNFQKARTRGYMTNNKIKRTLHWWFSKKSKENVLDRTMVLK